MEAMKVWHHSELKTQAQAWADQHPYEIYRDACRRMETATTGYDQALRDRWPTLGDANRAMVAAYEGMSPEQREYEDSTAQQDLTLLSLQ